MKTKEVLEIIKSITVSPQEKPIVDLVIKSLEADNRFSSDLAILVVGLFFGGLLGIAVMLNKM
jgi:hypothetical protein